MKKVVASCIALLFLVSLAGGCVRSDAGGSSQLSSSPDAAASAAVTEGTATDIATTTAAETQTPPVPTPTAESKRYGTVEEKLIAMEPLMDALLRTLGTEGEQAYDVSDPACVWSAIYLSVVNYASYDTARDANGCVVLSRADVERNAFAAFAALNELPEIPKDYASVVRYDAANDSYSFSPSDAGDACSSLDRWYLRSDGKIIAVLALYDLAKVNELCEAEFTISYGNTAGSYPCRIENAKLVGQDNAFWQSTKDLSAEMTSGGTSFQLSCTVGQEDELSLRIEGGKEAYTEKLEYFYNPQLHVASIGGGSNVFVLSGDTGSDDYESHIYYVVDGAIHAAVTYGCIEQSYGDGSFLVSDQLDVLGSYGSYSLWRLGEDGSIERISPYSAAHVEDAFSERGIELKHDALSVNLVTESGANGESLSLPLGTKLLVLMSDAKSYVICELNDGRLVRLELSYKADEWQPYIDGEPEETWFKELMYAG